MFQKSQTLFLVCETPLHAGSGDSLGIVDLPIQRERHTSFPKIEASSLKGALREAFEEKIGLKDADLLIAFGKEEGDITAAALGFTDARLLLFPIKSMKGVFAWVTCPRVLKQFEKDMKMSNSAFSISDIPSNPSENQSYLLNGSSDLKIAKDKNHIVLEEYAFKATAKELKVNGKDLQVWLAENLFNTEGGNYWAEKVKKDIVILSDDDFKDFVNLSTEVITRTKIDNEKGTVVGGALFTEEFLPTESVLYALVLASPEFSDKTGKKTAEQVMSFFTDNTPSVFQLGGNATLGKGVLRTNPNSSTSKTTEQ